MQIAAPKAAAGAPTAARPQVLAADDPFYRLVPVPRNSREYYANQTTAALASADQHFRNMSERGPDGTSVYDGFSEAARGAWDLGGAGVSALTGPLAAAVSDTFGAGLERSTQGIPKWGDRGEYGGPIDRHILGDTAAATLGVATGMRGAAAPRPVQPIGPVGYTASVARSALQDLRVRNAARLRARPTAANGALNTPFAAAKPTQDAPLLNPTPLAALQRRARSSVRAERSFQSSAGGGYRIRQVGDPVTTGGEGATRPAPDGPAPGTLAFPTPAAVQRLYSVPQLSLGPSSGTFGNSFSGTPNVLARPIGPTFSGESFSQPTSGPSVRWAEQPAASTPGEPAQAPGVLDDKLPGDPLGSNVFDYRKTFFDAFPHLKGKVVVHHAVPQHVLRAYPGAFAAKQLHSLENLRGIPKELNSDLHLSKIAKEWKRFYRDNPRATSDQLLRKRTEIDNVHGHLFSPPVRGRPQ